MSYPKCHRCADGINAHGGVVAGEPCSIVNCDCQGFIWPDSLQAAFLDLDRALRELGRAPIPTFLRRRA